MKGGEAHFLYVVKKFKYYPFVPSCFSVLQFGNILQIVGFLFIFTAAWKMHTIEAPILGVPCVDFSVVVKHAGSHGRASSLSR
jgi:hypothetical protein